jgi:hypothetical protein
LYPVGCPSGSSSSAIVRGARSGLGCAAR